MVDATGRRALLARMMGVARLRDQLAVAVCAWYTATQQDHDARTYIEAVSDGWWYTARVPAGERVVLFHGDPATASKLLKNTDRWHAMLAATRHIGRFVENADLVGELSASEACGACLQQVAGDGWLAVGDAALSFDPISSQGIFNALYTGMRGAQASDAAMNGSATALHDYSERLRQVRRAYLQHFHHAYGAEQRWANRPFWKSRAHGVTANTHSEK
jgi:flavin-dependent dehydrogenase